MRRQAKTCMAFMAKDCYISLTWSIRLRALLYDRYGGPEVLALRDVPDPSPAPWECLVRVHAASVNPADWKLMSGQWRFATGRRFPRGIGIDFAGTVAEAGPLARRFRPGDRVMGMVNPLRRGSIAEYVCVPAGALSRVPRKVGFAEAAGIPVACGTAYLSLHHRRRDLRGRRVLLTGAGGGVGHFALQLAARAGAEVTAVCSQDKAGLCRGLGASKVVDYALEDPLAAKERFDLILDCASSIPFARAHERLTPRGEYLFLDTRGHVWPFVRALASQLSPGRRQWTFLILPGGGRGQMLAGLFESLALRVLVGGAYSLREAPEALRQLMRGHSTGKLLIRVDQ
jgi:NADPH:quinone reductase-like Zn-dependent oxidoreductase